MKRLRMWIWATAVLLAFSLVAACGDDSEKPDINDVLVGTWAPAKDATGKPTSIEIESDQPYDVLVDRIEFTADKRFNFVIDEFESYTGTYEAGEAYLRFDYDDADNMESLLWQLLNYTETSLKARYKDSEHDLTVTVTLYKR